VAGCVLFSFIHPSLSKQLNHFNDSLRQRVIGGLLAAANEANIQFNSIASAISLN